MNRIKIMYNRIYIICKILFLVFISGLNSCNNSNLKSMNRDFKGNYNKTSNIEETYMEVDEDINDNHNNMVSYEQSFHDNNTYSTQQKNSTNRFQIPSFALPFLALISQFCNIDTQKSIPNRHKSVSKVIANTHGNKNFQQKESAGSKLIMASTQPSMKTSKKRQEELEILESKIFQECCNHKVKINSQLLVQAIHNHKTSLIYLLLGHPNVDAMKKNNEEFGMTLLHYLVQHKDYVKEAKLLINYLKRNGAHKISGTIASLLIDLPNDICKKITNYTNTCLNIEDTHGNTPLDICKNLQLKTLLKRSGAFYSDNVLEEKIKNVFKYKGIPYNKGNNILITQKLIKETIEEGDIDAIWLFMCHYSFKDKYLANLLDDRYYAELNRCSSLYEKAEKIVNHSVPSHQIANVGLNVRAYCDNQNCSRNAYKNGFWLERSIIVDLSSKKDGGDIFISKYIYNKVKCPWCFNIVRLDGVGFRSCKAKGSLERIINRNEMPTCENLIQDPKSFFAEDLVIYFRTETGEYNTRFFELVY